MKTLLFKTLLFSVSLSLLFGGRINAQYVVNGKEIDTTFNTSMNRIFGTLDASKIPFGLLRDYAMELTNLENFSGTAALVDSNKIDKSILREIYITLATARMTSTAATALPNPSIIDSLWFIARTPGQVTLCGLFYQYAYLASNADSTGKITVTNGQLFDKYVNGVWQNPYQQGKTTGFAPSTGIYQGKTFNILLPANLWLTNSGTLVNHIEIDAGDGLGYRTIAPGSSLPVSYADTGMKAWNFKLYLTDNSILQSHTQLHVLVDPLLSLAPNGEGTWNPVMNHGFSTTTNVNVFNVTSTATYNGKSGRGLISVQLAHNHTSLTKPLIVAEGFDPGIYTKPETAGGEYTLGDFNRSINKSQSDLINLLESSTAQYDIVFIDFKNGTDDIRRNALVVEDVIRWVNDNKTGSNKNVVLGLSMGGLCARYGLKKMENAGETHNVSLFISHGVPEQGVAVPLGLQALDDHMKSLYMRAGIGGLLYNTIRVFAVSSLPNIDGIVTLTDAPAAKQMLTYHLGANLLGGFQYDNSVHNAWQTEIKALGYPVQGGIRNIAISNGSECGQAQTLAQGGQILYLDGKINTSFWGDIADMFIMRYAGVEIALATGQPALLLGVIPGRNDIFLHFQANASVNGGGVARCITVI
jgi:hypothetical protein